MLLFFFITNNLLLVHLVCFFFFQAEDGIRDLVRSRGLGDVYKRQFMPCEDYRFLDDRDLGDIVAFLRSLPASTNDPGSVSYTHLTLPTSDLV